jgi:hypothetical protein
MLLGRAAVCIWNRVSRGFDEAFCAWHSEEHMPERMSLPGFLRGRRYISEQGEYFTLYEVAEVAVLVSPAYLERLDHPTDRTLLTLDQFRDTIRTAGDVAASTGGSGGAVIGTLTFDEDASRESLRALLTEAPKTEGIVGRHLCLKRETASNLATAESRKRPGNLPAPAATLLVEGVTAEIVARECDRLAGGPINRSLRATGVYRHQVTCEPPAAQISTDRSRPAANATATRP